MLTRADLEEMLSDMEAALDVMRRCGCEDGFSYTRLWRQARRIEEKLFRHPVI